MHLYTAGTWSQINYAENGRYNNGLSLVHLRETVYTAYLDYCLELHVRPKSLQSENNIPAFPFGSCHQVSSGRKSLLQADGSIGIKATGSAVDITSPPCEKGRKY
jgi:hypothetical protein